jgi:hypothetical protein
MLSSDSSSTRRAAWTPSANSFLELTTSSNVIELNGSGLLKLLLLMKSVGHDWMSHSELKPERTKACSHPPLSQPPLFSHRKALGFLQSAYGCHFCLLPCVIEPIYVLACCPSVPRFSFSRLQYFCSKTPHSIELIISSFLRASSSLQYGFQRRETWQRPILSFGHISK